MGGSLEHIRVLDLTTHLSGPFCAMVLGDHGADVIKIEQPGHGDDVRNVPPFANGESIPFMLWNRNKRGIVLDLKDAADKDRFLRLVETADVCLESNRPGVMERLGLDWKTLSARNPRLILGSVSGFGQTGPLARQGGFDVMAQAMSGLMAVNGPKDGPPHRLPLPLCDLSAGLFLAIGVLSALEARHHTGRGQHVDTSLLEAATALQVYEAVHYFTTGESPPRAGQAHRGYSPYQVFPSADGYVTIGAAQQKYFRIFCELAGVPALAEGPRFAENAGRVANNDELVRILSERTRLHPTDWWVKELSAQGIPNAPVLSHAEVFTHPQIVARRMIEEVDHPKAGRTRTLGIPLKLSETPGQIRRPAPTLGQHNAEILSEIEK